MGALDMLRTWFLPIGETMGDCSSRRNILKGIMFPRATLGNDMTMCTQMMITMVVMAIPVTREETRVGGDFYLEMTESNPDHAWAYPVVGHAR